MTEGTEAANGHWAGRLILLGSAGAAGFGFTVDPAVADYFNQYGITCVILGAAATLFYLGIRWGDGRPTPPIKQLFGQAIVTFMGTAVLPLISEGLWPSFPKTAAYGLEFFAGSIGIYAVVASADEGVRTAKADGKLRTFLLNMLARIAGAVPQPDPNHKVSTQTVIQTNVATTEVHSDGPAPTVIEPVRPAAPGDRPAVG